VSRLAELLSEIDKIDDDTEFMKKEFEFVREYCKEKDFNLSEDDMNTVMSRGLGDWVSDWKDEHYSKDV
jgi:hypothetical protein